MTQAAAKMAQSGSPITVREDNGVLFIGINRPEKRNAINDDTVLALDEVFSSVPKSVGAAVLYGVGDHFCAGLDLSSIVERDATEGLYHSRMWHRAMDAMQYGPIPVIAAMKGAVVGGGLELAASCHIRVADETAFFGLPEGMRGIFVGGGASVRVPRLIGTACMMDMMLTGRTYNAADGERLGISQYRVAAGEAEAKAETLARRILKNSPLTNYAVVQALPRIAEAHPHIGSFMESLMAGIASSDKEAKARLHDFLVNKANKVQAPK